MILRHSFRILLQLVPGSDLRFWLLARTDDHYAPVFVRPGFHLTVDGFPRSANTWIYYQVQLSFPDHQIAHHVHSWQQFMFSRLFGVRSVLVLRHPDASVQSLLTKRGGTLFLGYLDYLVTNGLASLFAHDTRYFEDLVCEGGMSLFLNELSIILDTSTEPVDPSVLRKLMATRTDHKNVATPALDVARIGPITRLIRTAATRLYGFKKRSALS